MTGAHERATRRKRTESVKARFRAWAKSVIHEQSMMHMAASPAVIPHQIQRTRREGDRPSTYRETTATNRKRRATAAEMTERRLRPQRQRMTATATCTELGKRTRDEMTDVAKKCSRMRAPVYAMVTVDGITRPTKIRKPLFGGTVAVTPLPVTACCFAPYSLPSTYVRSRAARQ